MKLNKRALREAVAATESVLFNVLGTKVSGRALDRIAERIVSAYQSELAKQSFHPHNTSPISIAIGKMEIGEELRFNETGLVLQHIHNYIKTARRMLNAPFARFRIHEPYKGTFVIRRIEDNAHVERDPFKNSKAVAIAAIPPGRAEIVDRLKSSHELGPSLKMMARRILQNPDAQWSAKATTKGIIVTRLT